MRVLTRYALSRDSDDRWPIEFRPDCERTFCDVYGNSKGLMDIIIELDKSGYDLIESRDELIKILKSRGIDIS